MGAGNVVIIIVAIISLLLTGVWTLFRERPQKGLFLCAALVVTALLELFDLLALARGMDAIFWKKCGLYAEAFLPPFWILSSLTYARQPGPWKIGRLQKALVAIAFLFCFIPMMFPLSVFFYAPDFPGEHILFLGNIGFYYYLGILACLVVTLVNFEATLVNASPEALWQIKLDIIGLGTIVTVFAFYFSQAFLYRTLNMGYILLRSIMVIAAVAMISYSKWYRRGRVQIQVSRQVAFKSFVLFAVGLYLIMLGLLGEGMSYLGGAFTHSVTISLAFLAGVGLLILLLSERFRREVKVVLHKNFYQNKHDYRAQWLRFTEQLSTSTSGEELLQRILFAYCDIFGMGGATLFLYEEGEKGYCAKATYEMDPIYDVISPDNMLVGVMKKKGWVINVKDCDQAIREENSRFFEANSISFVIPLFNGERLEGFIALGRVIKQDEVYIYEDYDLMKTIARQASQAILHHRFSEQIAQALEMEAINNVATFVVHDLKNLVATLSLIIDNANRYMPNPDFQKDMLTSLGNTAEKMGALIGRLKNLGDKNLYNVHSVDLLDLVTKTAAMVAAGRVTVSGKTEKIVADGEEIQKVVMNLFINAVEASDHERPIRAEVGNASGAAFIRVTDEGCGMSDEYIHTKLFKPFKSTKKQGLGIGLYQCRKIIEGHGGRIEVTSKEGSGSVFTVWFPQGTEFMGASSTDSE